ncbi:MAG TPA: ATP-dependent RecD-like DNA helicase [Lachnospiraceae bacterium]|nr:ATP-dependent RecD-like DNA helicase [Lachnospiraceae bacterium]
MAESIVLSGTVEDIIFQNAENGYAVFSVDDNGNETICVGVVPNLHSGESLKITGSWTVHPTYGRQLSVDFYEKTIPTTTEGIEKYLSSGVIKGIGPKTAKKIVAKFGEATFYVIEEKPDRLVEIKGINYEKAMRVSEVFREQHELRRAMMFLQDFGVSPIYAMKIYKKYKGKTFDIVNTNPYRLADDIFGIGFKMADKLAASAGIEPDSSPRIKAGIKYILNQAGVDGHVYLPLKVLLQGSEELLGVNLSLIENALIELQMEHQIWQEKINDISAVYLNMYYYAEISVSKKILELLIDYEDKNNTDWDLVIDNEQQKAGISLAEKQRLAVREAMTSGVLIITGGPGTGKTTTINTIIRILENENKTVVLGAPTGRAAKRMTEATGVPAQTIHRILGINFLSEDSRNQTFAKDEDEPIEADVIIIDESSMVDILLMNSFLKAVESGTRLILVGDVDQLPSVGAGNVLKDIIKSNVVKVVRLNEIFRQAQESAIITNAHRINQGLEPIINEKSKDFFFVRRGSTGDVVNAIKDLIMKRLPAFNGCEPSDIQVLTPMRKGTLGVYELNKELQQTLNPPSRQKKEKAFRTNVFRQGDKVMQIKNNYNLAWKIADERGKIIEEDLGVFNGDCGIIADIDDAKEEITVLFDDNRWVDYDYTQLDELELSYAVTIHKSQGSEYPVVIVPIHSGPPMLLSRNLLYTAVTRAKNLAVMVGIPETMNKMVHNNREINRYSSLDVRICSLYDFMHQV